MRYLLSCISIFLLNWTTNAQVTQFHFNDESGSPTTQENISNTTFNIINQFDRPERIEGISGNALRLDGHSTFVAKENFQPPNIERKLAIELWYATEAFNSLSHGLISQLTGGEGFAIKVTPFGMVQFQVHTNDRFYLLQSERTLEKYQWNHIVAQIDLDEQEAAVYVNGERWSFRAVNEHEFIDLANTTFYIGRGNDSPQQFGFLQSVANGAIDELSIYNTTFTAEEIATRFNAVGLIETDLYIDPNIRHPRAEDHLRPRYHVMPNTSWTNEAYGLTYHNGKYHLFSQKNPNAPTLYFMHWGHYSSPDLVTWEEEKIALAPQPGFSDFGIWSGTTTFDKDGKPVISYTGVNGQFAGIGMAFPKDDDLIEWELPVENPVVERRPAGNFEDFRDPYIFQQDSAYYMVVGGGVGNNGGGALISYKSTDLLNWERIPNIFADRNFQRSGYFWEMPSIFPINEKDFLFIVTPLYRGLPAQTVYWLGEFENEFFYPYHEAPKKFEHLTRHLLAPAFGQDETGRWTYIGIIPEDRDVNDQIRAGWRQTFSLPRVVRVLNDTTLGHYPHPNLCRLRQEEITIEPKTIAPNSNFNLPEIKGQQCELEMTLVPSRDADFSLQLLKNEAATLFTSIDLNVEDQRMGLNRRLSSPFNTKEDNRFEDYIFSDTIRLRAFVDHSIVEVFVDNLTVVSGRVYPGLEQDLFDLVVKNGSLEIVEARFWELGDKEPTYEIEICEPSNLPDAFFTNTTTNTESVPLYQIDLKIYPNPASDSFTVELPVEIDLKNAFLELYTLDGKLLDSTAFKQHKLTYQIPESLNTNTVLLGKIVLDQQIVKSFELIVTKK